MQRVPVSANGATQVRDNPPPSLPLFPHMQSNAPATQYWSVLLHVFAQSKSSAQARDKSSAQAREKSIAQASARGAPCPNWSMVVALGKEEMRRLIIKLCCSSPCSCSQCVWFVGSLAKARAQEPKSQRSNSPERWSMSQWVWHPWWFRLQNYVQRNRRACCFNPVPAVFALSFQKDRRKNWGLKRLPRGSWSTAAQKPSQQTCLRELVSSKNSSTSFGRLKLAKRCRDVQGYGADFRVHLGVWSKAAQKKSCELCRRASATCNLIVVLWQITASATSAIAAKIL